MDPPTTDIDMIEALLASMHNQGQLYDDVDDDDDDEYDEDDDEDDDDGDSFYDDQGIQNILNYGGGAGDDLSGAGGNMQQISMNFLQSLLNMNTASIPGMADVDSTMSGMSAPLDGGSGGGFLPAMQNILPNINSDMAGALAGAFAGTMGSFMDYGGGGGGHGGATIHDYDDDEEEEDDDDETLSDEEDEEDDEGSIGDKSDIHSAVTAGVGGLMAGLLAGSAANSITNYHRDHFPPSAAVPTSIPPALQSSPMAPSSPAPPIGFTLPPAAPATNNAIVPYTPVSSCATPISSTNMSGGTVSKADPLAVLMAGAGGAAIGSGVFAPIVSSLLGNGGETAVVNKMSTSGGSTIISPPASESFSVAPTRLLGGEGNLHNLVAVGATVAAAATAAAVSTHTPQIEADCKPIIPSKMSLNPKQPPTSNKTKKLECEDDGTSLDSAFVGSEGSGGGKSDTESFGKKTPSPVPQTTASNHAQEKRSCNSIIDLASATESMRDSDTDYHSEAHNVTANLSDADSDVHVQQKRHMQIHYMQPTVATPPVVCEIPTYGWGSMLGLDNAKDALKKLFYTRAFPAVFEGTEGICRGILLFGPSGSGKTCLARALAKEANNSLFIGINSSYFIKNQPEPNVIKYMFERARHHKPAVILFDEIDYLSDVVTSQLSPPLKESAYRAKEEIIAQMKGATTCHPPYTSQQSNEDILVLGTTNQPWCMDDRIRRLFAYNIHVKLPNEMARKELFKVFLETLPNTIKEEELRYLAAKSEYYSAADISNVVRQASQRVVSARPIVSYDDLATCMTHYNCRFNEQLKDQCTKYIKEATHTITNTEAEKKDKKDKPKGVKKISQRIAKTLATAVIAVID